MPQAFYEFLDVNPGNLHVFPNIFPNLAGISVRRPVRIRLRPPPRTPPGAEIS